MGSGKDPKGRSKKAKAKGKGKKGGSEKALPCLLGLINRAVALLVSVVGVASMATSYLTKWPIGTVGEFVLVLMAALILVFHMFNFELRGFLGHRQVPGIGRALIAEFVLGCGIPYAMLLAFYYSSPTWSLFSVAGLFLLPTYFIYEPAQEMIRSGVSREDLWQGTDYFGTMQPLGVVGIDKEIIHFRDEVHGPNYQALLGFFVGDPWIEGFSRTRTVILAMMLVCLLISFASAAEVGIQEARHRDKSRAIEQEPQGRPAVATGSTKEAPAASTGDFGTTTESASQAEPHRCRGVQAGSAPAWARSHLRRLYLGHPVVPDTNPPPGFEVGGCPGPVITRSTADGIFVYTIGRNAAGEVRSVAMDSKMFGPGIALAPAAQRVIELIDAGLAPVGVYPSTDAGGGDVAGIPTPGGTWTLVRSSKHPPGKTRYASPYVELAPTASSAWVEAMDELGLWLWPMQPVSADGTETFDLVGKTDGEELRLQIGYNPETGIAQRGGFTYSPPEEQLRQRDLESHAKDAWYGAPSR